MLPLPRATVNPNARPRADLGPQEAPERRSWARAGWLKAAWLSSARSRPLAPGHHVGRSAHVAGMGAGTPAQPIDPPQDRGEQRPRYGYLSELEDDIPPVAHDPGADLDQALAQRRQRPLGHLIRQRQRAQEVGQVVGQRKQLQAHRVVPEGAAGQPGPAQGQLALPDPLLRCAAPVVELADPFRRPLQVGHDEADPRIELAPVPLDLRHHATRSGPARGLVVEAGVGHDRLLGWPSDRPGQQVADPPLQHLVGR
jgi:hypothetical protein